MTDQPAALVKPSDLPDCVDLCVDVVSADWGDSTALVKRVHQCVAAVLVTFPNADTPLELAVRLTDDADIQQLNRDYRHKDKPTNVLSFASFGPSEIEGAYNLARKGGPPVMLGDIIMTHGVTSLEAEEQGKLFENHVAHLVVHGLLHLLGFDHIEDADAHVMEAYERKILAVLGIDDPYREGDKGVC